MGSLTKEMVLIKLKDCVDPEIPTNVVDLGLIYDIKISESNDVDITMTLTTRGCPMHSYIANDVREKVSTIEGIGTVNVSVVWDPPWTPDMMTEEGRKALGMA